MRRVSLLPARVWEKRRRRFALPAQSKKGFVECSGKRSATPLLSCETKSKREDKKGEKEEASQIGHPERQSRDPVAPLRLREGIPRRSLEVTLGNC